jgi:hypothetical protein
MAERTGIRPPTHTCVARGGDVSAGIGEIETCALGTDVASAWSERGALQIAIKSVARTRAAGYLQDAPGDYVVDGNQPGTLGEASPVAWTEGRIARAAAKSVMSDRKRPSGARAFAGH